MFRLKGVKKMKKYRGIKKAAGYTKGLTGWNGHTQIAYDPDTDTVYSEWMPSVNEWNEYHDPDIVSFTTTVPMTMEEIKDRIENEIAEKKQYQKEMEAEHQKQMEYVKYCEKNGIL